MRPRPSAGNVLTVAYKTWTTNSCETKIKIKPIIWEHTLSFIDRTKSSERFAMDNPFPLESYSEVWVPLWPLSPNIISYGATTRKSQVHINTLHTKPNSKVFRNLLLLGVCTQWRKKQRRLVIMLGHSFNSARNQTTDFIGWRQKYWKFKNRPYPSTTRVSLPTVWLGICFTDSQYVGMRGIHGEG